LQFLSFGTKFKCDSCGDEFKTESELRSIARKSINKKLISIFPKLYFSQSCNGGSMAQKL
jgi:hypothetical protein